jgi:hypothetical protein
MDLLSGVDLPVHDAQYLDSERPVATDFGHATVEDAVALAGRCGAGALVPFDHAPSRTDEAFDEIAAGADDLAPGLPVSVAGEGTSSTWLRQGLDPSRSTAEPDDGRGEEGTQRRDGQDDRGPGLTAGAPDHLARSDLRWRGGAGGARTHDRGIMSRKGPFPFCVGRCRSRRSGPVQGATS